MRKKGDTVVNPIYEWTDSDVWTYIRGMNIETNPLYEQGFNRVGCIGCPMASYKQKMMEFEKYPQIMRAYIRAFDRMLENIKNRKQENYDNKKIQWSNGQEVFDWWIEKKKYGEIEGQQTLEGLIDTEKEIS